MILKNLTDNAKNLAANSKIEDMSRLFKNHMAGKQDIRNPLSGVMVNQLKYFSCLMCSDIQTTKTTDCIVNCISLVKPYFVLVQHVKPYLMKP
jgi:hypothetical protein